MTDNNDPKRKIKERGDREYLMSEVGRRSVENLRAAEKKIRELFTKGKNKP